MMLQEDGWSHMPYSRKLAKQDYVVGDPKVWLLHPKAVSFNTLYLQALLSAGVHKKPVKHNGLQASNGKQIARIWVDTCAIMTALF